MRMADGKRMGTEIADRPAFKILYINRDKDTERRESIQSNFAWLGLEADRISAVDGRNLPAHLQSQFPPSRLTPGEVGCYASHLLAWQKIVDHDISYALVLEDDAALDRKFSTVLSETIAAAPQGWDFIHFCTTRMRMHGFRPLKKLSDGRSLVRFSRVPSTTRGYLLSNAGARKLLKPIKRTFPIDLDTRLPWKFGLDSYGVIVAPIDERPSISTISPASRAGRSRLRRGVQVNNPLHTWAGLKFNVRKLGLAWWLRCLGVNMVYKCGAALAVVGRRVVASVVGYRSFLFNLVFSKA